MLEEAQIPVAVTKNLNTVSCVKRFHVYQTLRMPVIGECLLSERKPEYLIDKYAVCLKKE